MKTAILGFVLALASSYFLTPLVIKLATRFNVIDHPSARRVHDKPTPRWGGLAIYIGFVVAVVLTALAHVIIAKTQGIPPQASFNAPILGVLLGGTVVALFGLLDDKFDLSPVFQIAAITAGGAVLLLFGVRIAYVNIPFGDGITLGWLAVPITLIWIFAVTKTVDLMDGLDGLAAGICAIASATLLVMTFRSVDTEWALAHSGLVSSFVTVRILSASLLGASLGFLRFNYPPAKIFMGTIGAQFMGFTIATASIVGAFKVAALVAIAVPLLVLAVPILDTAWVVVKRAASRRPVMEADKSHVHHRLLERGLTQRQTIWVIYVLTAALSTAGLLVWFLR